MKIAQHVYSYSRIPYMKEYSRAKNQPNAIFIWIPKTAGTSLFSLLDAPKLKSLHLIKYRFVEKGTVTFGHIDYSQLVKEGYISKSFNESAYKFAIVRNPYARAVSLHTYLKKIKRLPFDESFLTFCRRLIKNGCDPIGLYNSRGLNQCNPQLRWVENISMDFIGQVETINKDVDGILKNLQLQNKELPQFNVTTHSDYRDSYCVESKEIIETFYKDDFSTFNYCYEDFPLIR